MRSLKPIFARSLPTSNIRKIRDDARRAEELRLWLEEQAIWESRRTRKRDGDSKP